MNLSLSISLLAFLAAMGAAMPMQGRNSVAFGKAGLILQGNIATTTAKNQEKRDGSSEFDTDLCILKKRGGVLGNGINNCDI